ncbi:hypothetical protein F511_14920 [Dorcoceras hygrometricum]|uniref:Uncharacterized protein n=1 Tax=Dorcoceras hygrometricum TaxID=472368 RepID=A0A2Z7AH63_9LAMI|nr:hypothetical protein F511_14920 [Dorcoceras hygrometricum]
MRTYGKIEKQRSILGTRRNFSRFLVLMKSKGTNEREKLLIYKKMELHDLFTNLKAYEFELETRSEVPSTSQPTKALAATTTTEQCSPSTSKSAEQFSDDVMSLFVKKFGKLMRRCFNLSSPYSNFHKSDKVTADMKFLNCDRPRHFAADCNRPRKEDRYRDDKRSADRYKRHDKRADDRYKEDRYNRDEKNDDRAVDRSKERSKDRRMRMKSGKRPSRKHDRKVLMAEESTKSWADTDSDSSSSSSSSSDMRDGLVVSTVHGVIVEISEQLFAETFELPVAGLTDLSDVPKDKIFYARSLLSASKSRFLLMTAITFDVKVNCGSLLFGVLKAMVTPGSRQAKGFAIQIGVLLQNVQGLVLGESKGFPKSRILEAKTVHRFVHINEKVGLDESAASPRKKRTTKGKPVVIAQEAVPPKFHDATTDAPVEQLSVPKRKSQKRKRKLVLEDAIEVDEPVPAFMEQPAVVPVVEGTTEDPDDVIEQILHQLDTVGATDSGEHPAPTTKESIPWFDLPVFLARREAEGFVGSSSDTDEELIADQPTAHLVPDAGDQPHVSETVAEGTTDDELLSIKEHQARIPFNASLRSTLAPTITPIRFGQGIEFREVDAYKASLPQIDASDKGKGILVEDYVQGHPAREIFSLICADIEFLIALQEKVIDDVSIFVSSFSLRKLATLQSEDIFSKEGQGVHRIVTLLASRRLAPTSFTRKPALQTVGGGGSSIRSTTGIKTPLSAYTRRTDEFSTDGNSSAWWPEQVRRRGGGAWMADGRHVGWPRGEVGGRVCVEARDTASRGTTTIVTPKSQFRTCPTDHDSIGYPRMRGSGESSTTKHRLLHVSGHHPIPPPNDSKTNQYNQDLGLIHSTNGNHLESPNEGSSIDHQVAAIRSEQLEFQAKMAADFLRLSTQIGALVDYIRGGDAKNGEGSSSLRPLPAPVNQGESRGNVIKTTEIISPTDIEAAHRDIMERMMRTDRERDREIRERRLSRSGSYKRRRGY